MRSILVVAAVLSLGFPHAGFAEPHRTAYTTLAIEFVGETDRFALPVVISSSPGEGEWYKQHLSRGFLVYVEIVPPSMLNQITDLPLLRRALASAKPVDDQPRTIQNVRFTAGVGHDHAQIMVDAQTSARILEDIAGIVAKYPTLKGELQEIEGRVKP